MTAVIFNLTTFIVKMMAVIFNVMTFIFNLTTFIVDMMAVTFNLTTFILDMMTFILNMTAVMFNVTAVMLRMKVVRLRMTAVTFNRTVFQRASRSSSQIPCVRDGGRNRLFPRPNCASRGRPIRSAARAAARLLTLTVTPTIFRDHEPIAQPWQRDRVIYIRGTARPGPRDRKGAPS